MGGEVAAALHGRPVRTNAAVLYLHRDQVPPFVETAERLHRGVIESRHDDAVWELWCREVCVDVLLCDALPGYRLVRLDFAPWLSDLQAPVMDLQGLIDAGSLGPTAPAVLGRMACSERSGSITESVL